MPELRERLVEGDLGPIAEWDETYNPRTLRAVKEVFEAQRDSADDPQLKAENQEAIDRIDAYLGNSTNIHGKAGKCADPYEKARKSVAKAINIALDHIRPEHSSLYTHLDAAIHKGTFLSYQPTSHIPWEFV